MAEVGESKEIRETKTKRLRLEERENRRAIIKN